MLTRHVSRQLARYCDGQLTAAAAERVEAHLASCARCQAERDEIQFAARLVRQLAVVTAPASVWNGITTRLAAPVRPRSWFAAPRLALASAIALLVAGVVAYWVVTRPAGPWEVTNLTTGDASARLAEGAWIETDPNSRARIKVGAIGTVDLEPGARVRLGVVRSNEYRLALARGTISAQIDAPPRLFFVETPSSTVVDLGCAYTVTVNDDGGSDLHMTQGWAAIEGNGRESLVPAGAICRTRPNVGPGTPYFEDAAPALQRAVDAFDFRDGGPGALDTIVKEARVRDTLTLWHLLSRVEPAQRSRIFDRMAELVPPPPTVSRDKALQLDADTLRHWREELAWKW